MEKCGSLFEVNNIPEDGKNVTHLEMDKTKDKYDDHNGREPY